MTRRYEAPSQTLPTGEDLLKTLRVFIVNFIYYYTI